VAKWIFISCPGYSIFGVALTYRALGRHADALVAWERVLDFFLRVLPDNHSAIGEGHVWSDALRALC
jgi:hypothetical protein